MLRSQAEDSLRLWEKSDKRVYKYIRPLLPDEFVVIEKKVSTDLAVSYLADAKNSTYFLEIKDVEHLISMKCNGDLKYIKDYAYMMDVKKLKTGGCTCGAWILKDSEFLHAETCDRYKRGWNEL